MVAPPARQAAASVLVVAFSRSVQRGGPAPGFLIDYKEKTIRRCPPIFRAMTAWDSRNYNLWCNDFYQKNPKRVRPATPHFRLSFAL
jgi:hypothetical protein